jgi:cell fate regulator YaaT (PSP1 superfamily)
MKLVSVHYLLDEPKILFFFTAENRVDFRELVKDLVAIFRMRIELRQIGVRDESRVVGGLGVCGRGYCCNMVSDKLKPVSIKMAKDQNLSLNSMKISGPCGRLLCCLAYEHTFYSEQRRLIPQEGCRISYDGDFWKVSEVNIAAGKISLGAEDGRILQMPFCRFEKIDNRWTIKAAPDCRNGC